MNMNSGLDVRSKRFCEQFNSLKAQRVCLCVRVLGGLMLGTGGCVELVT